MTSHASASVSSAAPALALRNPRGWAYAFGFASLFWLMTAGVVLAVTHPPVLDSQGVAATR